MVNVYCRILGSPFCDVNALVIRLVWYCFSLAFISDNLNVCVHVYLKCRFAKVVFIQNLNDIRRYLSSLLWKINRASNSVNSRFSDDDEMLQQLVISLQLLTVFYLICVTEGRWVTSSSSDRRGLKSFASATL